MYYWFNYCWLGCGFSGVLFYCVLGYLDIRVYFYCNVY